MIQGFFKQNEIAETPKLPTIPQCEACGLYKTCKSPKMEVTGSGRKEILIVAEAPGREEDRKGIQLVGNSGQELMKRLRKIGIDMRKDCWLTNAVICRPPENRTPTKEELTYCSPNLRETIEKLKPAVILTLGIPALKSMLLNIWDFNDSDTMTKWAGWRIPMREPNAWLCPTWHPAYFIRDEKEKKTKVASMFFNEHLEAACDLTDPPWSRIPKYEDQVQTILSEEEAVKKIKWMTKRVKPIAFDYETNMLKPDSLDSRIWSCSICWNGERTIAYPWTNKTSEATKKLLLADHPKIGANIPFEQRWSRAEWGHGFRVRNWLIDVVNCQHVLDCRKGIISVKFQALVRLGQPQYNKSVEHYLRSEGGGNSKNRIDEIEIEDLLLYNGVDSIVEYLIALQQLNELGIKL